MRLLLVEDNARLAASLCKGLGEDGFLVECVGSVAAADKRLACRDLDAVVLDLGLPDGDGLEILTRARAQGVLAPVLVLTARDAVSERVRALDAGADDYLLKPFAFAELVARLHALLRRASQPRWAQLAWEDLVLAPDAPTVTIAGRAVALSPREHALLGFFMRRRGEVLGRAELLRDVFGYNFDPGTNIVDVHVANLRRKLTSARVEIATVRGAGYKLSLREVANA